MSSASLTNTGLPALGPGSDGTAICSVVEALRADANIFHNLIVIAESVTTNLTNDLAASKETIDRYTVENEKVKAQLRDTIVNHDREVNTLRSEMNRVQARLEGAINEIKGKITSIEVVNASLQSDKASTDSVTVEITKAISVLEDRVKTELVHGTVKQNLDKLDRKIESIKIDGGTGSVTDRKGRKPITEYTSIQNLKSLNGDGYTEWKDKFTNRVNQVRPGYEAILKHVEKNSVTALKDDELQSEIDLSPYDIDIRTLKEGLWCVLLDKTEGEARGKVKSVGKERDGIEAYRVLHEWFTRVTNLGLQDRRTRVMMPTTASNEGLIVQSVERW